MRTNLFVVVLTISCILTYAQNSYFSTTFKVDSAKFCHEANERLDKMTSSKNRFKTSYEKSHYAKAKEFGTFNCKDSLKVVYVYGFDDFIPNEEDVENNKYLAKLVPHYNIISYRMPLIYGNRYPKSKRLDGCAFIINQNNQLVGKLESSPEMTYFLIAIRPVMDSDIKEGNVKVNDLALVQNVLSKDFDRLFYVGCFRYDYIWCVKGDTTTIYDVANRNFIDIRKYIQMYKGKLSTSDYKRLELINSYGINEHNQTEQLKISVDSTQNLNDTIVIKCVLFNGGYKSISFEKVKFAGDKYLPLADYGLLLTSGDKKFILNGEEVHAQIDKAKIILSELSCYKFLIAIPTKQLYDILQNQNCSIEDFKLQLRLTLTKPKGLEVISNKVNVDINRNVQ